MQLNIIQPEKGMKYLMRTTTWMKLENIMLSERSHTKGKLYDSIYMKCSE